MNAHTPFDANQDWTNPYCQNSSNDPTVDALLGNAYHVVRTVYCNLGNLKLIYDFLNQYGMVLGVQSEAELKALTTKAKYARIYGFSRAGDRQVTDYLYVEGDRTGILPDDTTATGSWITVATSGSNGGGTSSGEGAYIPWVYSNGSAAGGETTINVPDGTVGVPFIIINGDMQYVGRGFEFNVDSLSVTLAQPLEEGDEVVFLLTGTPAVPDNPNVNDWVQINWLYNNGAAVGGEQVIAIPYTFQSVPAVYKNGLRLAKNLATNSYLTDPDNQSIILTEPLITNDRVIIQIGGEARVLEASDRTVQEVARSLNVSDSAVILSTNTTSTLNGKKFLYSVDQQKVYELPPLPSNVYISTVSGQTLIYNPGEVQVILKEVVTGNVLQSRMEAPNGAILYPELQIARWRDEGDVRGWGAKVDGVTDDSDALIAAINSGRSKLFLPAGRCVISKTLEIPAGVTLEGQGIDYWDTWRPDETRLLKSWDKGTHIVVTGTGLRNKTFGNLSNERPVKTVSGTVCEFTKFTNEDASGTTPATLKSFSVAVTVTHASQLKNLRILLNNNGIDGYNDFVSTALGDDWDIGLHVYDSSEAVVENVQICGYWRVAGTLLTENDGSFTMRGNPERTRFNRFFTQGIRGLLIRNSPQIDVVSNTTDSVTFKKQTSLRITATNSFRISGSATQYVFTGSTTDGTNITLTGVTPALPASIGVIRFPNIGNNFSGTVFENTVTTSFEHSSGNSSDTLGLPVAFAMEIDGYPIRNLRFDKFKAQTTFDKGNTLFGDCRDIKITSSEFENGLVVAYSLAETQGYTGNLRLFASDIQASTDTTGFNPRDAFLDNKQIKTDFTDGSFILKNWRDTNTRIQFSDGSDGIVMREGASEASPGGYYMYTKDGLRWLTLNGVTKSIDFAASNGSVKYATDNSVVFNWYGASGNMNFKGTISPLVDNSKSLGTGTFRWSQLFAGSGTINTSDAREKTSPHVITDDILDAWGDVSIIAFQWLNMVKAKGGDSARWHFGVIAQQVRDAFNAHGIDGTRLGLLCYDEWEDQYEPVMATRDVVTRIEVSKGVFIERVTQEEYDTGETKLVVAAGSRWGIRPDQCAWLEAAYQRRRSDRIEERLAALEKR